jgi:hypothetical protein
MRIPSGFWRFAQFSQFALSPAACAGLSVVPCHADQTKMRRHRERDESSIRMASGGMATR